MDGNQVQKAYCYTCFSKTAEPIGTTLMTEFMNTTLQQRNIQVIDSFVDTNSKQVTHRRHYWRIVLEKCVDEGVKLIVVPAMSMLMHSHFETIMLVRDVKKRYGIDFYFLFEDILTSTEDADSALMAQSVLKDEIAARKTQKKALRSIYTQVAEGLLPEGKAYIVRDRYNRIKYV